MLPHRTLILGGAASGKSAYAEKLIYSYSKSKVYLATSQAFDDEMRAKINAHIFSRGAGWETIEAPFRVAEALSGLGRDQVCLLDCATMWLSNLILAEHDLDHEVEALLSALASCPAQVVVVSNEVGQGIVPDNALARGFREAQGRLNIRLAESCDTVVQVVAGLPNVLKGAV